MLCSVTHCLPSQVLRCIRLRVILKLCGKPQRVARKQARYDKLRDEAYKLQIGWHT